MDMLVGGLYNMKKVARVTSNTNTESVKASTGTAMLDDVKDKLQDLVDTIENMYDDEYEALKQILGDNVLDRYMDDLQDLSYNI